MDKLVFHPDWETYFQGSGFKTFDDFYDGIYAQTVDANSRRDVQMFTMAGDDAGQVFFIKRFHRPHVKDVLSAWRYFGRPLSLARIEWDNARMLMDRGVGAYEPVCMGQRLCMGWPGKSFLVTRKLDAVCLVDYLQDQWATLTVQQRQGVIADMAKLVRELHDAGVSVPDLYVWHLFVTVGDDDLPVRWHLIDLHRMVPQRAGTAWKHKQLARLYWSLAGDYVDADCKTLLIDAYGTDNDERDQRRLRDGVRAYAAVLEKRRHLKRYYRRS